MQNLIDRIFSIQTEEEFNECALEVYDYQVENCDVYREFILQLNKPRPTHYLEIPFLPISFFKHRKIITSSKKEEIVFKSSGTTATGRSHHYVHSTELYEQSFLRTYNQLIGNPKEQVILALLPNYLEQGESSLVYMVNHLIYQTQNKLSGFLLNTPEEVQLRYQEAIANKLNVVIFGVSYALLDLAEQKIDLSKALIIETGGMKGRRKELSKEELHLSLNKGFQTNFISSEYGMTELLSQGYSQQNGLFQSPNWMKILIRDVNDPLGLIESGKTGGINVIDLANIYSCSFIATQDLGKKEGKLFRVMGRFDNADIRGCNLLVQ